MIQRLRSRGAWATFSTSIAALSTVAYLFSFHGHSAANEFIHLYSTVGMLSAWLNTILFFYPEHSQKLYRRSWAFSIYLGSVALASVICFLVFGLLPSLLQLGFVFSLFLPILAAPAYGFHLRKGSYPAVLGRGIVLNFLFFLAALPGWILHQPEIVYAATALILPLGIGYWVLSPFFSVHSGRDMEFKIPAHRVLLNPSSPVLERTITDQYFLLQFQRADFTFWFYALSRMISFAGNIFYSVATQTSLDSGAKQQRLTKIWLLLFLVAIGNLVTQFANQAEFSVLLGQAYFWLLAATLLTYFERRTPRYEYFMVLGLVDFAGRILLSMRSDWPQFAQGLSLLVAFGGAVALGVFAYESRRQKSVSATT